MARQSTIFEPCSIVQCVGNAHRSARGRDGICANHVYRLMKYGDPLGGRTPPGEPLRYLNEVVFAHHGEDCLVWPYARNSAGYGHLIIDGRHTLVSRAVCEHRQGPAPFDDAEAAHSCGRGHLGCCNQDHLRWDTTTGNFADKAQHGTLGNGEAHYAAKLTEADVLAIRASSEPQSAIAKRYGVEQTNISAIKRRKSWKHVA